MKICFFNTTVAWGGGEKWHLDMARELEDSCTKIFVVAHEKGALYKEAIEYRIPVIGLKLKNLSFLNPFTFTALVTMFKREKPDVVILNLPRDLKAAGLAARRAGVKKIIYRRGSAIPIKNSLLNRYLFKKVITGVIANSQETKNTILKNNATLIDKDKIKVIYNGIDLNTIENSGVMVSPPNPKQVMTLGNLGRMVEQKGQEDLIELAVLLKKKEIPFHIIIGGSGPKSSDLTELSRTKGVEDFITFPGFITDVKGFMQGIDVFVLPSRWEGFGYVLVEAMAMGKPVLAYRLSSNPEIINEGSTGWLFDPMDVKAMAERIASIYHNMDLLHAMSPVCKKWVSDKFTIEKAAREVGKYLSEA